jgi:putative phage-type endonuclease
MARTLVKTTHISRADWLDARMLGIGGSDIAAIMGLTPRYRTQIDVWLEKTGQETPGARVPFVVAGVEYPSEAAYWGTVHEDNIANHFTQVTGWKTQRRNAILQHDTHDWMLANLDREALHPDGRVILECKSASAYLSQDWADDRVPVAYQAQCQWYMAIHGAPFAFIAALVGGNRFAYTRIERDDEVIGTLIAAGERFWRHVIDRTMPPVDGSERCAESLARLYPASDPEAAIDLPPTLTGLPEEIAALKAQRADIDEQITLRENLLKAELGATETAWCGNYRITWKTVTSHRLDGTALKAAHPELHASFTKPSTARRFDIKQG